MSQTYLMTIALGPVQDFIAAARRLRDLWFGSYLLSELSKQAARSIQAKGGELIFPAPAAPETDLAPGSKMNVPNKLLAKVSGNPGEIFRSVESAVEDFWRSSLAENTIRSERKNINLDLFKKQIEDFLEIYGAWVPLNGDYTAVRKRVDQLLAARKTLRAFKQVDPIFTEKGGLPKSSLDGMRESVLSDEVRNRKHRRGIKEGEELDAVGWVKRYGKRLNAEGEPTESPPIFESLSDLAADPFLRGAMERPAVRNRLNALARAVWETPDLKIPPVAKRNHRKPLDHLSPQILFPTSLKREMDETEKLDNMSERKRELLNAVGQVHRAMDTVPRELLPYTAILVGDGDNMGQSLGKLNEEGHRRFSRELDQFANECGGIVDGFHGSLIYSGGDDVMAFVPLDQALPCAEKLRLAFAERMRAALPGISTVPTLSTGLAIVHHLRPMNLSLNLARKAERLAKSHDGKKKNALAIILEKRGGAPLERVAGWEENGTNFVGRLLRWTEYHRNEWIPDKFGYQLRHLHREFGKDGVLEWSTGDGEEKPANPLAYEFIRVLKRKRAERGSREVKEEHLQQIIRTARNVKRLDALADELILTRLIADAEIQAGKGKDADHDRN